MSMPYRGIEILEGELFGGMLNAKIIVYEGDKSRLIYRIETHNGLGLRIVKLPFVDAKEGEVVSVGGSYEEILKILPQPPRYRWTVMEFLSAIDGFQQGYERARMEEERRNKTWIELPRDRQ